MVKLEESECKLLTVTDNIESYTTFYQMFKFFSENTFPGRTFIRNKAQKLIQLNKDTGVDVSNISKLSLLTVRDKKR